MDRSINQSTNLSTDQSANQRTNQSPKQPTNQPTNPPTPIDCRKAGVAEPEKKETQIEGLSKASIERADWLLHQLMLEVPRVVEVIEVTTAAAEEVTKTPAKT